MPAPVCPFQSSFSAPKSYFLVARSLALPYWCGAIEHVAEDTDAAADTDTGDLVVDTGGETFDEDDCVFHERNASLHGLQVVT